MSETDSVFQEVDDKVARLIRTSVEMAQAQRWRLQQQLQGEMAEQMAAERHRRVAIATVAPTFRPALKDEWWGNASPEDAAKLIGLADRFRHLDPLAQEVWSRAEKECSARWGIDINNENPTLATTRASDEEIAAVEPRLDHEPAQSPDQVREQTIATAVQIPQTPEEQATARASAIQAIQASTSMPNDMKARLLAKLEADAARDEADAETDLTALRNERETLETREDQLEARVQDGDTTAEAPLAKTQVDLIELRSEEIQTEGAVDTAHETREGVDAVTLRGSHTEDQHAIRVREESTQATAAQSIKNVQSKNAKAKGRRASRNAGRARTRVR